MRALCLLPARSVTERGLWLLDRQEPTEGPVISCLYRLYPCATACGVRSLIYSCIVLKMALGQ